MAEHRNHRRVLRARDPSPDQIAAGADEELTFYIDARVDELVSLGMTAEEARRAVEREFGDLETARRQFTQEAAALEMRARRATRLAEAVDDIRRAWRSLRRSPGFVSIAVITLALGIGANTAIFSVVNGTLWRPLPYADPDALVRVTQLNTATSSPAAFTPADFVDYRTRQKTLTDLAAYLGSRRTVHVGEATEQLSGLRVTSNLFEVLRTEPLLGRVLRAGEDQERVAIVSYEVWQRLFGGDSSVVGSRIMMNERAHTVVGVMPQGFSLGQGEEYWIPFNDLDSQLQNAQAARRSHYLNGVARLKRGVTTLQAQQDLRRIARELEREYPATNAGYGVDVVSMRTALTGDATRPLVMLAIAAALVLCIACANLANLLLSRSASRRRELAVHSALGATHRRLIRQTLAESVLLSCVGAALGVGLASSATRALLSLSPTALPRMADVRVNGVVLGFTAVVSILSALVFAIAPAARALRVDPSIALKESGRNLTASRGALRIQRVLVVGQMGLAVLLLICAGLLIRSIGRVRSKDAGFDARGVVVASIVLGGNRYDSSSAISRFYEALFDRVRAQPGVEAVGAIGALPTAGRGTTNIRIEGRSEFDASPPLVQTNSVTDDYFRAMRVPLLAGRSFNASDRFDSDPVVVISETMARRYWTDARRARGQRIRLGIDGSSPLATIVGIVGDVRQDGLEVDPEPMMYSSYRQAGASNLTLTIRTGNGLATTGDQLRSAVRAIDDAIPVSGVRSLERVVDQSLAPRRFLMMLLSVFAMLALVLAATGAYSAAAYSVVARMPEFGIQIALGATRQTIVGAVLVRWLATAATGMVVGVVAAVVAARVMRGQLYEIGPLDSVAFSVSIATLLAVSLMATLGPALRASGSNPVDVLRRD